jgi:hypothetical protein
MQFREKVDDFVGPLLYYASRDHQKGHAMKPPELLTCPFNLWHVEIVCVNNRK